MTDQENVRLHILEEGLPSASLSSDPLEQFTSWMQQAKDAGIRYCNTMSLATVDKQGIPFQRLVMLKQYDAAGFQFFTSQSSQKVEHLESNSNVCLLFPWHMLERQVQVHGRAEKLSKLEIAKYFASRPKNSQLSSWLSQASSPVTTRGILESKLGEIKARFSEGKVSVPPFWGGYRVIPYRYEFWQTGKDGVNDRFIYQLKNNEWLIERAIP